MNEARDDDDDVLPEEKSLPQEFILKMLGRHEARGMWGIKHTRDPVDAMVKLAKTQNLSLPLAQVVITKEGIFVNPIASKYDCQIHEGPSYVGKPPEKQNSVGHRVRNPKDGSSGNVEGNPSRWSTHPKSQEKSRNTKDDSENKPNGRFNFCLKAKREVKKTPEGLVTDLRILEKFSRFDWSKAGLTFYGIDTISYGVQDLIFTRVFSMIVVLDRRTKVATGANSAFVCHAFVCESRSTAKRVTYALAAAFQAYGRAVKHLKENEIIKKAIPEAKPRNFVLDLRPPSEYNADVSEA